MKYMGSKLRISKDIAPIINKFIKDNNIRTYIEPFVGGCNMIEHILCDNKIGSDNNDYLISMWKDLQCGWQPPNEMSKGMYLNIKENKEEYNAPCDFKCIFEKQLTTTLDKNSRKKDTEKLFMIK